MRKLIFILLFFLTTSLYAEYYKVNVIRVTEDLYKDNYSGVFIKTSFCFEYAYGEDAVLKYDDFGFNNMLIFQDGTICDVVGIFK